MDTVKRANPFMNMNSMPNDDNEPQEENEVAKVVEEEKVHTPTQPQVTNEKITLNHLIQRPTKTKAAPTKVITPLAIQTTDELIHELRQVDNTQPSGKMIQWLGVHKDDVVAYQKETDRLEQLVKEDILFKTDEISNVDTLNGLGKQTLQDMNRYWTTVTKQKRVTGEMIIKLTYKNHRTLIKNSVIKEKLNKKLEEVLGTMISTKVSLEIVKNFYVKEILWLETIIPKLIKGDGSLKGVWLTSPTKRDGSVLLRILEDIGFTILYRNMEGTPLGEGNYKEIANYIQKSPRKAIIRGTFLNQVAFDNQLNEIERVQKEQEETVSTVANEVQKDVIAMLHSDDTGLYRDWQFENFQINVKRLKTTFDEISILWKEPAKMRNGFEVNSQTEKLVVPTFFVKIEGTTEDIEKYWILYDEMMNGSEMTASVVEKPLLPYVNQQARNIPYSEVDGFKAQDILAMNQYKYSYLRKSLQDNVLHAINIVLFENKHLSIGEKYEVLNVALNIPEQYLEILQKNDFVKDIPKLVVYRSTKVPFRKEEGILVELLRVLGMDIVFLNPSGYTNIENVLLNKGLEIHRLHTFIPDLDAPTITQNIRIENDNSNDNRKGLWGKVKSLWNS